jgi:hypothetical protein
MFAFCSTTPALWCYKHHVADILDLLHSWLLLHQEVSRILGERETEKDRETKIEREREREREREKNKVCV